MLVTFQVSVFYMGRLENKSIFDARVPPKKPFSFKLGVPEVIRGLDIGIKGKIVMSNLLLCKK